MHPCSCSVLAAASVLDYRPSTVAVAAVLAAAHGAMTKEALECNMSSPTPSCLLDKVRACSVAPCTRTLFDCSRHVSRMNS